MRPISPQPARSTLQASTLRVNLGETVAELRTPELQLKVDYCRRMLGQTVAAAPPSGNATTTADKNTSSSIFCRRRSHALPAFFRGKSHTSPPVFSTRSMSSAPSPVKSARHAAC